MHWTKFLTTTLLVLGFSACLLGVFAVPEPYHVGVIWSSFLVIGAGLTLLTYRRLDVAQERTSII